MIKKSIAVCKLDEFKKKIDFLNKKLRNFGKPVLTFTEGNRYVKNVEFRYHEIGEAFRNDTFKNMNIEFVDIVIEGLDFFKKDDCEYNYIGSINYEKGIKTVYCIDDEKYLTYFKEDPKTCDHCKTKRHRNSYSLFEGNGKIIRVGSNCCRDFFGYDVSNSINCYLKTLVLLGEADNLYWEDNYEAFKTYDFHMMFKVVRHCTNNFSKWEKSKLTENGEYSGTTNFIREELDGIFEDSEYAKDPVPTGIYKKIASYWDNQDEDSTFAINMKESIKKDYCVSKNIGSYAYAIFAAINHERKTILEEENKKLLKDCPFKEGERVEISGVVTHVSSYRSYYDSCLVYCIEFLSDDNVLYYMSTSSLGMWEIMENNKITIKGTISGRNDYREKKRWQLKRPKLLSIEK